MNNPSTDKIRNVAIVGHSGCGKTTLAEALLLRAGVLARAGRVEDGTTVCDTEPEEAKRSMSLSLALAPFEWKASDGETYKVNLIDTPGYADFAGDVDAALAVADLAVLVVSAVDGVEVGTELAWSKCAERRIPRLVFVNKEDKPRADFRAVVDHLKAQFGSGFVPLELPLGEEEKFHGVADVLTDQGFEYEPDGRHHSEPIPADVADEEHRLHDELVEEIVAGDDEQLERYLSGEVPSASELERTLAHEVLECAEFPVLVGSATAGIGVDRLADFICELGPSPADRPAQVTAGTGPAAMDVEVTADPSAKPLGYVFKTVADQFVGQVSLFKVLSGTVAIDDRLVNTATGTEERLHALFHMRGREHLPTNKVVAGDLAAVAKLAATPTGSTLAPKDSPVRVAAATARGPVVRARPQADHAVRRRQALGRPPAADRRGSGARRRAQRRDGADGAARRRRHPPRGGPRAAGPQVRGQRGDRGRPGAVPRDDHRFGRGRGQDQEAVRRPRPVRRRQPARQPEGRGEGAEFVNSIVGGAIPKQYIPAVQRGVEEAMASGGVHGFPVVDVRVECYDGKFHSVDSSDMAFRTAAAHGLREALQKAGAAVLEPVSLLNVVVPAGYQGDVLGDLNSRRGRVNGTSVLDNGNHEIVALVPAAEIQRYAVELRSMTGGRGTFSAHHDHYELLPSHLTEKVKKSLAATAATITDLASCS